MQRRAVIVLAMFLGLAASPCKAACESPRLQGTFLQLTTAQAERPERDWQRLFAEFHALGLKRLFLQWTVYDRTAFFQTTHFTPVTRPPLPLVLRLAKQSGMEVWVGLRYDSDYWNAIKQNPDILRIYFRERLRQTGELISDLDAALAGDVPAGWYIPDEIDDKSWLDPERRAVLIDYLAKTVALLKQRHPEARVAISGFSNAFADPELLAAFWKDLVAKTSLNLLLFQDGIGEGKMELDNLSLYFAPLGQAVRAAGGELGDIVELFALQSDGKRVPAPLERVRQQLAAARNLTSFPPVAFSVPDYMSSQAGLAAARLLESYERTRDPRCE